MRNTWKGNKIRYENADIRSRSLLPIGFIILKTRTMDLLYRETRGGGATSLLQVKLGMSLLASKTFWGSREDEWNHCIVLIPTLMLQ